MNQMKAIGFAQPGGPEVLSLVNLPRPKPSRGEHLVKVAACGVNRPDVLQRRGGYPVPQGAPLTLGLELAGEIVENGGQTRRFKVGDKVTALVQGGGYAEYAVVAEENALPIPHDFSLIQAAALPARPTKKERNTPCSWWLQWHWHNRHSTCQSVWRAGGDHCGLG
jgi:NADPH2:quinone reductase